jgi:hypothetical protein
MQQYYTNSFDDGSKVLVIVNGDISYTFTSPCSVKIIPFIDRCLALYEKFEKGLIPLGFETTMVCGLDVTKFKQ